MRKKILDIDDMARLKKVHPGTVYHWVEKGLVTPIRIGRSLFFSLKEVQRWQPPKRGRPRERRR